MPRESLALKQAVRRNPERFPADFMFELDPAEVRHLVSQSVIPRLGKLGGPSVLLTSNLFQLQHPLEENFSLPKHINMPLGE